MCFTSHCSFVNNLERFPFDVRKKQRHMTTCHPLVKYCSKNWLCAVVKKCTAARSLWYPDVFAHGSFRKIFRKHCFAGGAISFTR
jgi:hypothetical protein